MLIQNLAYLISQNSVILIINVYFVENLVHEVYDALRFCKAQDMLLLLGKGVNLIVTD